MSLSAGQRALIEAELVLQQTALQHEIELQRGGASRVEQAAQLLADDPDAPREHEGDREVTLERADRLMVELREVGEALLRLRAGTFGRCADCEADIPLDRLRAQPTALRCLSCQAQQE
ncbi:DnaK suppressor protein [Inhella inkyongensis]|uniref:DnaK suppressor protein n=1 Tax=Inhella inkyongensis TaxID=392593 RepID=A0A840S6B0_9BURK|nr:TraR/DksA family transcriptional regulator [Inhella inkyongensis]MBB5205233.1 DnaK suppressor protein [Inhella inkyongensis]